MKKQIFFKTNTWIFFLTLFAISFSSTSCNKDEEITLVTVDDAAELVAFSIANRTYGAVNDLNYVANNVLVAVGCNESESNARKVTETSIDGEISVTYDISENYAKSCNGEEMITYSFNADQELTSVRLNLDQNITGTWSVAGVENSSTELTYNGDYNRTGLWTYNLDDNHTDNVTFSSVLQEIKANPDNGQITSGTANFQINGTSTSDDAYSYSGSIEFQGNDISIITFQTGEQYELNLETGEVTRI